MTAPITVLEHVRKEDGTLVPVFPLTSSKGVLIETGDGKYKTLSSELNDIKSINGANIETVTEDNLTIIKLMGHLIMKPIRLNHIYLDDFSNKESTTITSGTYLPGKIII